MSFWTWANPGDQVLVWTVNVIFQVTLVMAVALAISVMFRRIAAIRYWLLGASLVLVMLSPAIALLMQRGGFGVMSVSLIQEIEPGPAPAPVDVQPEVIPPPPLVPEASFVGDMRSEIPPPTPLFGDEGIVPDATPPFDVVPSEPSVPIQEEALVAQEPVAASAAVPVAEASTTNRLGRVLRWTIPPILAIWIIGVVIHLIRLAVGWRRVLSILRSAQPNDDPALQEAFRRVGLDLSIRGMPELVLTDAITGPISAGLRRPRVILPTSLVHQIGPEQMHDILLHEVAHIVRRDQAVVLLQNFAAAMYWLHPLMRTLNRHLAQAREEVCDNYVLAATDAPSYSRTLLTLAQLVQSTSALPGTVGLFSSRWKLEHRVAGLLDERRNRTVRTSLKGKLIVAGIATVMLTLAAFGTMTLAVGPTEDAESTVENESTTPAVVESEEPIVAESEKETTITGVVLRPDGSPAAGATVRAGVSLHGDLQLYLGPDYEPPISTVTSDDQGRFEVEIDRSPFEHLKVDRPWGTNYIAASMEGFGPAWVTTDEIGKDVRSVELKLVDDIPIRGRVIDLEGKPVAGLMILLSGPRAMPGEDLSPWIDSISQGTPFYNNPHVRDVRSVAPQLVGLVDEVTTADDGSFEIRGIGRERMVDLEMQSETVAFQSVRVVTRDVQPLKMTLTTFDNSTETLYGAKAVITATLARTIVGTVVDAVTGQPLPNVRIEGWRLANNPLSGRNKLTTFTDAAGKFRLVGMPKGEGNRLMIRPNDDQPYFMREIDVPDPAGLEPVSITVELHRGIWITGRVTDKITAEPIPATRMYYLPYLDNEYVQDLPGFQKDRGVDGDQMRYHTDAEGRYRLVGMPGRAVIGAQSILRTYRFGVGYEHINGPKNEKTGDLLTYRNPLNPTPKWPSAMLEINPPADAEEVQLDFELDPGASVQLELVDAQNQPVSGADVKGLSRTYIAPEVGSVQTVVNLGPDETRTIVVHHNDRNIGRVVEVGPDEVAQKKIIVRVLPCAMVTGILQKNGDALPGLSIEMRVLPGGDFGQWLPSVSTDADGRFTATLIPGCKYSLHAEGASVNQFAEITRELEIQSGETKDLGVLSFDAEQRKFVSANPPAAEQPKAEKKTSATTSEAERKTITGVVLLPDGSPAAWAMVRAGVMLYDDLQRYLGKDFEPPISVVTADIDGRFEININRTPIDNLGMLGVNTSGQWGMAYIAASSDGFGPAWVTTKEIDSAAESIKLKLVEDLPIQGRVIDLEGKPIAGLTIQTSGPYAAPDENLSSWLESITNGVPWYVAFHKIGMRNVAPKLAGIPEEVTTADDGSFTIHGIGRERTIDLVVQSESVAYQTFRVVTRKMQPLNVKISNHGDSTEPVYGHEFIFAASPARTIVGTVVDAATHEPLSNVTIESYRFANHPLSGRNELKTTSDAEGDFRLIGMPKGDGNYLMVKPNDEQPYFMQGVEVPNPDGLDPVSLTVELHRGIWITGRVTDKVTGEPVPATRMYYLPFRDNEFVQTLPGFDKDGNVRGDQTRYQTDRDGRYRLVGMPGRAIIGAQSILKTYRMGVGYEAIDAPKEGKTDWLLTYRNPINPSPKWPTMMLEINPASDAETLNLDFELDPGASVQLYLVDEQNAPVTGVQIDGLGGVGYVAPAAGSLQTAINFGPDEKRSIVIHHKDRNIGRVVQVGPGEVSQQKLSVKLLPCVKVTGVLLKDGDPLPGLTVMAHVQPGGDFSKRLSPTATDTEGRFTMTLIPGCNYSLHAEGTSVDQVASIARELEIQPGETKDLGVLTLGDDRKFIRVEPSAAEQPDKTGNAEKKTSATGDNNIPLEDLGIGVRVVGPEGEPLNGVSIDVSFPEKVGLRAVTRVGDDGSFRIFGDRQFFERAAREFGRYQATITAAKDGLGSDVRLMMLADLPGSMLELQLQKLIDVHGRIVSAEGQPLPGVEIRIKDISRPATTMEEFIRSAQHDGSTSFEISDKRSFRPNEVFRTDADGRFSIPDVPAEHILSLEPRGSGVPFQLIFVASRSAPDSAAKRGTIGEKSFGNTVYYYAKFTHVAPPSRTIKGIVVDQKTGQPVDEINLHCFANGEQLKTGKDGRFEFTGCIKTDSYPFSVDTFTRPYFNRGMRIKDTPGLDPLEVRIELLQGTTLRGRVTGITGHVAGEVHYNVLYPSPYSDRMVDGSSRPGYSSAAVKADGKFDIQVLPGPGVVAFRAEHDIEGVNDFLSPWITVDDVKTTLKDGFGAVTKDYSVEGPIDFLQVATRAQGIGQVYLPQYHAATLISIGEDETDVAVELVVEKGTSLSGRVVDTDGQPVSKIQIAWLTEYSRDLQPIAGDQFTVRGISPKRPRSVMFFHEDLHQGAILLINGEEDASSPITVKLEPCGAVHGRFVDGKARPLADRLILVYPSSLYPYVYFGPTPWSIRTDKNGEYTIRNLVPGHEYSRYISLEKPNGFLTEKLSKETVKPGETVELGDKVIEILNVE